MLCCPTGCTRATTTLPKTVRGGRGGGGRQLIPPPPRCHARCSHHATHKRWKSTLELAGVTYHIRQMSGLEPMAPWTERSKAAENFASGGRVGLGLGWAAHVSGAKAAMSCSCSAARSTALCTPSCSSITRAACDASTCMRACVHGCSQRSRDICTLPRTAAVETAQGLSSQEKQGAHSSDGCFDSSTAHRCPSDCSDQCVLLCTLAAASLHSLCTATPHQDIILRHRHQD